MANPFVHMKPDYSQLPEEALRAAAADIEQAVQAGNREPGLANREGIVLETELIQQTLRSRAARAEQLNTFLDSGYCMEGCNGLVYVLRGKDYKKSTTGKERNHHALLVMSENDDRWALYENIVEASNLPPRSLSAVQSIFHEARLACMSPGQKYEDENGDAVAK
jgi:hypothetical protein